MAHASETRPMVFPPRANHCDNNEPQRQPYVPAEVRRLRGLAEELQSTLQAVEAKFATALRQEPVARCSTKDEVVTSASCELADELGRICSLFAAIRDDLLRMIDRCEL